MFVALGVVGVLLLVLAILFDDLLDGLIPENEWLSLASIAVFLGALGLVGWAAQSLNAPTWAAWGAGVGAGFGMGAVAARLIRGLMRMATDDTPTQADLLGLTGRMVTSAPAGSMGEAIFELGGQPVKVSALGPDGSTEALETGRPVLVVDVLSATRVRVEPMDAHGL